MALFQGFFAGQHFVLVAVGNAGRRHFFYKVSRCIKDLEGFHVVQILHLYKSFAAVDVALVVERNHHGSLEVCSLSVLIGKVYPVGSVYAGVKLDAFAYVFNNAVVGSANLRVGQEQVCEGKAVDSQIQEGATR